MSKNILLLSVTSLKERSAVHKNVDDSIIAPEIKAAQDMEILPALGNSLFKKLQDGIDAGNLASKYEALRNDYIVDALLNFVLAALPIANSYQFFTKGLIRKSGENSELPTMADMVDVSNFYTKRAEYYRERLIRYLKTNGADFPEYACASSSNDDIEPLNSGYTLPCWLGDD